MATSNKKKEVLKRVNTRIHDHQDGYIKMKVKKSKGELTEGEVHRELLQKGINADKAN